MESEFKLSPRAEIDLEEIWVYKMDVNKHL
jgi:plasmid stabilization system protein ParE